MVDFGTHGAVHLNVSPLVGESAQYQVHVDVSNSEGQHHQQGQRAQGGAPLYRLHGEKGAPA
eukprot:CAMPEP_0181413790 /NCGR_PEP_ID=MMETSP1110-20121109/9160_1 /TAXON_ID=174948 /ORGANISM="Symbiodinium sp., Strain CCMP421" /LENGTH=61 /DNA_ID=CAMNT_0023536627 /DNA_START=180 /DNA_END=361 /DNA_ORIENTATION=-